MLSEAEIRKAMGKGPGFEFLALGARDSVHFFDDFLGDTINLDNYVLATGATATAFAHSAHASGMIRGALGTTAATSGLQIYTPAMWYGDQNCRMEMRLRTSSILELRVEAGFASTLPAVNTTIVNSMATPTFNTTANGSIYLYNETGGTTTTGLYTIGTAISAAKTATTTNRYVADTFLTLRMACLTNRVKVWIDGVELVSHDTGTTNYVEGGTAMSAVVSLKANSTTDSNIDIDYIRIVQDRL